MRHKIKIIHKTTTPVWDREFSPSKICLSGKMSLYMID